MKKKKEKVPVGSYTDSFKSGMKYHGKGPKKRAWFSGRKIEEKKSDKLIDVDWVEATNDRQAFIEEYLRLKDDGGPKVKANYNKIQSPGKKYLETDTKKKKKHGNN